MANITVTLEGNIDDRLTSMRHLVESLALLNGLDSGDMARVDLTKLRYLGPDGVTMIVGSIFKARGQGITVGLETPKEPLALVAFLAFSGFNHLLLGEEPVDPNHLDNVTVALRQFRQSRLSDPDPIIHLIQRFVSVSENLQHSLSLAVTECAQNVEDHAKSPIGGLACARFMQNKREVRVAFVDWGQGVFACLQPKYPDIMDSVDALQRVLHGGYTARSNPHNFGRGIDNLRSVVTELFDGQFYILSGDGAVDVRAGKNIRCERLASPFAGTAVCFTLPVPIQNLA